MAHTFGYNEALAWQKIDGAIFEIDQKTSVQNKEEFIDLFMVMRVILAMDYRHPDDRIVRFAKRLIVPLVLAGISQLLHIDQFKRPVQNVEVSLVRKILRRLARFHGSKFTLRRQNNQFPDLL